MYQYYHSIDVGSLGIGARRMRGLRVREGVEGEIASLVQTLSMNGSAK